MVRVDINYLGALRTESTHGPSGTQLITDAPLDNHGKGESFSPTDLVGTALGSCMLTLMGIVAERHGWELGETSVSVEKEMAAKPVRRVGKLTLEISVGAEFDEKTQEALKRAALGCPVKASLHPDVELDLRFIFGAKPS